MSATITSRTIDSIVDQRCELANQSIARIIEHTSDWTRLRVGFRLAINGVSTIYGGPNLSLGLCAGAEKFGGDNHVSSIPHFVGISPWESVAGAYQFLNDFHLDLTGGRYYGSFLWRVLKQVLTTRTANAVISSGDILISGSPATYATAVVLEFEKGSPNWTVRYALPESSNVAAAYHVSLATLLEAVRDTDPFSGLSAVLPHYLLGEETIAVDEASDGFLDSIIVWWDRTAQTLELSGVLFNKFA